MPNQRNSPGDELVFNTKWFQIVARKTPGSEHPHYLINMTDFVSLVVLTTGGKLLLVRQFRPAVRQMTLEVVSGHVEEGETPEQAARKELLEETGHVADRFELLSTASPAIGRFSNKMWCYFVPDAHPTSDQAYQVEEGVEPVFYERGVRALMQEPEFCSSLSHSALFAAVARGRLKLD